MNAKTFASNLRKECSRGLENYPSFVHISKSVMPFDDEVEVGSWGFVITGKGKPWGRFGPEDERSVVIHVTPNLDVVVSAADAFPEELLDCLLSRTTVSRLVR